MVKSIVAALVAVFAVTAVAEAREIRIVGSSTVYPFTTIVGETFAAEGNTAPVIESTGTGGGMKVFTKHLLSKIRTTVHHQIDIFPLNQYRNS